MPAVYALARSVMPAVYALARRWYAWRRPDRRTAMVAVWYDGRVLAVSHSYKPGCSLPGGGLRRHESPAYGAARELREETGIRVDPARLEFVDVTELAGRYGRRTTWTYELRLDVRPCVRVNGWETIGAELMEPADIAGLAAAIRRRAIPCRARAELSGA